MIFSQITPGASIFLDANTLIYHFSNDPKYGVACTQLVKRIEQAQIQGFTSAHALADTAHRLMTLEAIDFLGWPPAGIAARLRKQHAEIPKLTAYLRAITQFPLLGIHVLPISQAEVERAAQFSQQHQLLTGDALVVATMQAHALTNLASKDTDFDRVPGITRYAPA
jgi:predicted nucleic acid-binding protein